LGHDPLRGGGFPNKETTMKKRLAIALTALAALTAGAIYACPPVSVGAGYCNTGHHATVSYAPAVSYATTAVSVVSPYTPTVSVPAVQYQQVQVAAPAAYEPVQSQVQVAAPAAQVSYATVAAPAVSYAVAAPAVSYARVNVGVGHSYAAGAGYSNVGTVRVSAARVVRAAPAVVRVKVQAGARRGLLGRIADRIRARRAR
jgi:hypothetical protein